MITRYLILITILIVCAGAAWYLTRTPSEPVDNAVLAWMERAAWSGKNAFEEGRGLL